VVKTEALQFGSFLANKRRTSLPQLKKRGYKNVSHAFSFITNYIYTTELHKHVEFHSKVSIL